MKERIDEVLQRWVAPSFEAIGQTATASAIQAWVHTPDGVAYDGAFGVAEFSPDRPFSTETPVDLASLTKVFTATLAQIAVDQGRVQFDDPIASLGEVTLMQFLNHSSGLPAWEQFYLRFPMNPSPDVAAATKRSILAEIEATPRRAAGKHAAYSDLGYIYLGALLERWFDDDLDNLVDRLIARPLGLESVRYVNFLRDETPLTTAAATEVDPARGGAVVGTVHDENCHIMGGVAGHAGLFGTAADVGRFGRHLLDVFHGAEGGIVSPQTLRTCWDAKSRGADGHHLGGWDTPSGEQPSAGRGFKPDATVGHLGFTGTSIWIDTARDVVAVLLTNRVYPTRENALIRPLRIAFGEAVLPPTAPT